MSKELYEDIKYGTNIVPEEEYLETIVTIADVAAEMVEKTLGPYGRTTMLNDGVFTYPTKDGWNVLKSLRFNDAVFNTLYGVLKQTSFDLVGKVGDATTTSYSGSVTFIHKFLDLLKEFPNIRQSEFLKKLEECTEVIVSDLQNSKYVRQIDREGDYSDIYQIASVASNGNTELARMIQDIYKETGNPNIYVSLDASEKLSYEIQRGYKLDCRTIMHNLYINSDDGTYSVTEPHLIFIFDHNVNFQEHEKIISGISSYANANRLPAIIVAPHFDDVMVNVLSTSMKSLAQQGSIPNLILIQVPLSMDIHRKYLSDLTLLTNAQVIDYGKVRAFNTLYMKLSRPEEKIEDALLNVAQYNFDTPTDLIRSCCGKIIKLVVGAKYILIQDFEQVVDQRLYATTMKDVRDEYVKMKEKADKSSTPLLKDYMDAHEHYTKLSGDIGVIKVGGISELQKHCLKDSVDDAVLACRSAYDNGYIRGLNLATLDVIRIRMNKSPEGPKGVLTDLVIYTMMYQVMEETSLKVLRNKTPDDVRTTVTMPDGRMKDLTNKEIIEMAVSHEYGYDAVTDRFMEDADCTIVNSVRTDVEVIRGMVSILSTVLTSNQLLSINRSFDREMGRKQKKESMIETKVEEYTRIAEAVSDVVIKKLTESGVIKS